jgi:Na+/phosphate symporter
MIAIIWPLFIAVIGLVMYLISTNPKVAELGKILFQVGALWTTYALLGASFTIGKG